MRNKRFKNTYGYCWTLENLCGYSVKNLHNPPLLSSLWMRIINASLVLCGLADTFCWPIKQETRKGFKRIC